MTDDDGIAKLESELHGMQQQLSDLEARQRVMKGMLLGLCRRWRQEGPKYPRNGPMCADELEEVLR